MFLHSGSTNTNTTAAASVLLTQMYPIQFGYGGSEKNPIFPTSQVAKL